eukprot:755240-Hanusia_phi.AAC.1
MALSRAALSTVVRLPPRPPPARCSGGVPLSAARCGAGLRLRGAGRFRDVLATPACWVQRFTMPESSPSATATQVGVGYPRVKKKSKWCRVIAIGWPRIEGGPFKKVVLEYKRGHVPSGRGAGTGPISSLQGMGGSVISSR